MKLFLRVFSTLFLLSSCTAHTVKTRELSFHEPQTLTEKTYYTLMKPLALSSATFRTEELFLSQTGFERLKLQGEELLRDLGAKKISHDGFSFTHLSPNQSLHRKLQTYAKWKTVLKQPKQAKLADALHTNYDGNNLPSLFSLPKDLTSIHKVARAAKAVLYFPSLGKPASLDIQEILTFHLRGFHVFLVDYPRKQGQSIPNWKVTCDLADDLATWVQKQLNIEPYDMLAFGKSFGTAPAIYAGAKHKGMHVILSEPFARMSDAVEYPSHLSLQKCFTPLYRKFVESYYRYPNEDWIRKIKGEVVMMGEENNHTERLLLVLTRGMSAKEKKEYERKHFIRNSLSFEEVQERLTGIIGTLF